MSIDSNALIGQSPQMEIVREAARRIAAGNCNVMVTGETGTGKELVARSLHELSARRNGPLVSFNCAAIPEALLESELFGHERGAFTGAWQRADGRIVEANHGTLFLDEVGELSLSAQSKMLRAIETRQVQRLGAKGVTSVDIRIVAATNQNLEQMVAVGTFRRDLYYRLNVARLPIPPLRERGQDVLLLARHFLRQLGPEGLGISAEAAQALLAHPWPGNVRELRNSIEVALLNDPFPLLEAHHLPEQVQPAADRDKIVDALRGANWNKSVAAKRLHWSRMTLYRKMAHHAITNS